MSVTDIPKIGLAAVHKGPEINEVLVARLEAILERAKTGEIVDGMFIGHDENASILTALAFNLQPRMFGSMDIVKQQLIKRIVG